MYTAKQSQVKPLLTSGYQIILDLSHLLHNEQFPCELVVPSSCDLMAPAAWGSGGLHRFRNASSELLVALRRRRFLWKLRVRL